MEARPDSPGRRRLLAALAAASLAPVAHAQSGSPRRLGILALGSRSHEVGHWAPMLAALAAHGHRENAGLAIEWRFAERSPAALPGLAQQLARLNLNAVVTIGTLATRALQRATAKTPIITGAVADPILGGFAQSLARPGGNVTGLSLGGTEIAQLQVGLLRSVVPRLASIIILRDSGDWNETEVAGPLTAAAKSAGLASTVVVAQTQASVEQALLGRRGPGAVGAFAYQLDSVDETTLAEVALRSRIPIMFSDPAGVLAGGLMSYVMVHEDRMKRVAAILDKVLRGTDPAMNPFELPSKSLFVLNRRTAAALGLSFPPELLARADEIVD